MRYRVARTAKGRFVCVWYDEKGNRHRSALASANKWQAQADAGQFIERLKAKNPKTALTVGQIVERYLEQSQAIWKEVDAHHWKAAKADFGPLAVANISEDLCRSYASTRGRHAKPGTIRKELGVLRAALGWAKKGAVIEAVPAIWLPASPPPRDRRLTRDEAAALLNACQAPHVRLFVEAALNTAGRSGAILDLRWTNVDLDRRRLSFGGSGRQKGRATVPINETLHATLTEAHKAALTPFVIEWAGEPVKRIKRSFKAAVTRAGLSSDVTPHVLRHTAASWMAEQRVPMSEIAAFLGHSDSRITERVYAKYSPDYLQNAAKALG